MRTVSWDNKNHTFQLVDQRHLPGKLDFVTCRDGSQAAEAIRNMTVRGAPAIGITAAFGLAAEACRLSEQPLMDWGMFARGLSETDQLLRASRPTAVNLSWALDRLKPVWDHPAASVQQVANRLMREAWEMAEEDVRVNQAMAGHGARLIDDGDTIIHHCNTGALAAVDWGTALGCIRLAHAQGKRIRVLVDETRPRLQGARLTAWELSQWGVPYEIITDNMAGYFLRQGEVQKVFFGADRIAANGDVANKIGTYMLALAANANKVPVYTVAPTSTIDLSIQTGSQIPIEERDPAEVLDIQLHGVNVVPAGAHARNPAFDITPHELLSAIITENGVVRAPFDINIPLTLNSGKVVL